jgi:phage shock protein A
MLSQQAKALRSWADQLAEREDEFGVVVRALVADLREAADTIESMRDSLNEVADKWANAQIEAEVYARENMFLKVHNSMRWHELFGTPERAARTIIETCNETNQCEACPIFHADINLLNINCSDYDALLKWLEDDVK